DQKDQDPIAEKFPSLDDLERDIAFLAERVGGVRLYSALDPVSEIPRIASKYGLAVTAGAWLDKRQERNRAEVAAVVNLARHKSVKRVIVGNESIMRADVSVKEMIGYLRQVRSRVKVPVSTAETWDVWLANPELVREVDFISIHVLPYWEGVPADIAVDYIFRRFNEVKAAYPDKHVALGEVGWPSDGRSIGGSTASISNQARVLREFLARAEAEGADYYVIEAFDQPWKFQIEGLTGGYWGLFDADRESKFALTGPVRDRPDWLIYAMVSVLLVVVPSILIARRFWRMSWSGRLFYAALVQGVASVLVWTAMIFAMKYWTAGTVVVWAVLLVAQVFVIALLLSDGLTIAEMTWTTHWRRPFRAYERGETEGMALPKVSVHVPIHNEPAHMVRRTLDALAALDYPDFEVLVIDNNTKDATVWQPVEEYCRQLGPRFRFFHLDPWPGYKAGALNFALQATAPDSEVVAVIDSDYIVDRDWLRAMIPHFANPKVGFVQSPQDHREWQGDAFKEMLNWEYAGFFHIGMVQRNERDAIIQHGTMTLVRRSALAGVGGWSEWCICEDAELGLRLYEGGWQSVYVSDTLGRGLVPDSFEGYKKQRFRWAFGAMQIMRRHWREMSPWRKTSLTTGQKFHFIAGWAPWIADGVYLLFVLSSLLWTVGLVAAPKYFEFPLAIFVIPTVVMFVFKLVQSLWLYQVRVKCSPWQRVGAAIAGMALTHSISKAMLQGMVGKDKPFFRTPKCEDKAALARAFLGAWDEAALAGALWLGTIGVLLGRGAYDSEARIWATMLIIQSVPYAAAVVTSVIGALPAPEAALATAPKTAPAPLPTGGDD
ncbi:MAG: glycosyltransferase, partial [Alphaproteobacteria bacterium]|nr:glycosyltransferase [Alphaproteobacteria bacterium]